MKKLVQTILLLVLSFTGITQSQLTIPDIMQGQNFVGYWPGNVSWSADSRYIYFDWNPNREMISSRYKTSIDGDPPVKVTIDELKSLPSRFTVSNSDQSKFLYTKYGDIYLNNLEHNRIIRLTRTAISEKSPRFNQGENAVIYQAGDNLFKWDVVTDQVTQLTNFVKNIKKDEKKKLTEQEEWLERDQEEYFEILRIRNERSEAREEFTELLKDKQPRQIAKEDKTVNDLILSPDERYVTYRLLTKPKSKSTKVPDFVTEEGYLEILNSRSKVGSEQTTESAWIYDRELDTMYLIQTDQLDGIYDKPGFLKDYHQGPAPYSDRYEDPRDVLVHGPFYNKSGTQNVVVVRSTDNKDRWIMSVDLERGLLQLIDRQRDEAWIGGPGIGGWNEGSGTIGWIDDETIFFQSEESGFSHLYTFNTRTATKKALTQGKFEIINATLSKDKSTFFITSNKPGPEQHQFYHLPVEGGTMTPITATVGGHRVLVSPDDKHLAILYSYATRPWELYVMENKVGAVPKQITQSTTAVFKNYKWRDPEIITFTAKDGAQVKARLYKPERRARNGAGVIFVHGAGYLQNVHKWWSSYYREYMFHNFLTDQGYTILDIDYRASNGYGRDWRTGIYRWMGGKDLSDQVDGAKYMVEELGIDKNRIGIYGGSYGGFITLMGLFTSPNTFKCGAALRSVTDWAHYNHGYTSNILNTPVEDSIAYYRSSPIYHAENLEGHLLMLHGMIDRNVQFQDVVRLSQRLIELGKDNWELAVFPKEGHGFVESSSWTDEYKRIYKLFETYLRK